MKRRRHNQRIRQPAREASLNWPIAESSRKDSAAHSRWRHKLASPKTRNPNSEANSKSEFKKVQNPHGQPVFNFRSCYVRICFEFLVSNFGFRRKGVLVLTRLCPARPRGQLCPLNLSSRTV
jgi:hypothetical protein